VQTKTPRRGSVSGAVGGVFNDSTARSAEIVTMRWKRKSPGDAANAQGFSVKK
jgi:hypothetical protein